VLFRSEAEPALRGQLEIVHCKAKSNIQLISVTDTSPPLTTT